MADVFSKEIRSDIMRSVKSKETKLEIGFRKQLWGTGIRYRKNSAKYPGRPDILIRKIKTVIFIDSCFWHGCPKHCRLPETNRKFWIDKIDRNKGRDNEITHHYKKEGWNIFRVWEHDIKESSKVDAVIKKINHIKK